VRIITSKKLNSAPRQYLALGNAVFVHDNNKFILFCSKRIIKNKYLGNRMQFIKALKEHRRSKICIQRVSLLITYIHLLEHGERDTIIQGQNVCTLHWNEALSISGWSARFVYICAFGLVKPAEPPTPEHATHVVRELNLIGCSLKHWQQNFKYLTML
jgi:hypothetical protein